MRQGRDRRKPSQATGVRFHKGPSDGPTEGQEAQTFTPHFVTVPIIDGGPLLGH